LQGILRDSILSQFKMKVASGCHTTIPHISYTTAYDHPIILSHILATQMGIQGGETLLMTNDDISSVSLSVTGEGNPTVTRRINRCSARYGKISPSM